LIIKLNILTQSDKINQKLQKTELIKSSKRIKMNYKTEPFPKGILKIKKGYNPNSSSIGTVLYSFPFAFIAISTILAICAAFLTKQNKK